jgi:ADP-ribose pyrophosphatase YjhB (NUDIX family)
MTNYYSQYEQFYVAVDCIIFGFHQNVLKLLLIKRKFNPGQGKWSLMGGFLNSGESIDEAAERVLLDLTGLKDVFMEQIGVFGEVKRDPGERVLSTAYFALINIHDDDFQLTETHNAVWVPLENLPALIFDHKQMVDRAIRTLRRRVGNQPIGFNLLPERFTLSQLQTLYEAIYGEPLDKRNFRKKIHEMDILEKLEEKDKSASKRGAYYYRFNKEKYDSRLENGAVFSFI